VSIARHHHEWLSLLEVSGPFLSLPVLMRVFPQGLEEQDSEARKNLPNAGYDLHATVTEGRKGAKRFPPFAVF